MTPLVFAAVVALSPPGAQPVQAFDPATATPPFRGDLEATMRKAASVRSFLLRSPPGRLCAAGAVSVIGPDGLPLKKLNELPPGLAEHAVLRTVHGCPVREVLFAGQTYYIEGADPQTVERLEGKRLGQR